RWRAVLTTRQDGRPRHRQVAADLRARIMSGELKAGVQLPSIPLLVERYGTANTTIQRALAGLKEEGFLRSHAGKGVFVRDRQPHVVRVGNYFAPSPHGYSYRLIEVSEARPPVDVAAALHLDTVSTAVLRHRLTLYDGEPLELSWSYYPASIAAGTALAGRSKIRGGAPVALTELGYPQRHFIDHVSARLPTTEELEGLALPDDVPVMRQFRVIYSDDDRPVEVSILIKPAHLYELAYHETIPSSLDS
ncbi:MAG: GntR family transcriptional regulator, partial [Pseudonocardiales bacterium]